MFEKEIKILSFMQGYGDDLLRDIQPDQMCEQPTPSANHPAWIIGHLAMAIDGHAEYVGGVKQLADWGERFGFGSTPTADAGAYPVKSELVDAWHAANARMINLAQSVTPKQLAKPTQGPLAESLPTVGDFISFSMTSHTSLHLGQLSAWRRAMGKPRLF